MRIIAVCAAAILLAAPASANEDERPDYGRSGWYAGVGGGASIDFFKAWLENNTAGAVTIDASGSFNARGGYRIFSWLALEGMYEGAYNYGFKLLDTEIADLSTHTFIGNIKVFLPLKRFQPYIMVGPGAQFATFNGKSILSNLDASRWDFALRFALGLDIYINENWLVDLEAAPSISFADYTNIPSESTDNVALNISIGVQYRF